MTFIPSADWALKVSMGMIPGLSVVDKFGVNLDITTATDPEDIWEFGGDYNYDASNTAPIQYVSSDSAADTQDVVVQGLDINGALVSQTATLTGTANVALTTPLWRVFRMYNDGATALAGQVYCHTDAAPTLGVPAAANVRALVNDGTNQTLMSLYTIPIGKVGFLYRGEVGIQAPSTGPFSGSEFANCSYQSRRYGKVFTVKKNFSLMSDGTSIHQDTRSFPDVIPALTDIKIVAEEVSADMGVWATFDILLVDEDQLSAEFLAAIGQPSST